MPRSGSGIDSAMTFDDLALGAMVGDAEQILVMKAMNDRGEIIARGSIDRPETRDSACAILEGAHEAFLRRAKTYGIQIRQPGR